MLVLALGFGCSSPDVIDQGQPCGPQHECPTGFTCDLETNRCTTRLGSRLDAAPIDSTAPSALISVHVNPGGGVNGVGFSCAGGECPLSVPVGSSVRLTANASAGFRFTGWSGDGPCASSTSNPLDVTVTSTLSCTANFAKTVNVSGGVGAGITPPTVTSTSPGAMCSGSACTIDQGGNVMLTAAVVGGKRFTGWSGDPGCTGGSATLVLNAVAGNVSCVANYVSRFTVAGLVSGASGEISAASTAAGAACSGASCVVDQGATATLTAPAIEGYRQTGWSGSGCTAAGAVLTVPAVTADVTCTATYAKRVTVTTSVTGVTGSAPKVTATSGGTAASCPGDGSCVIDAGGSVTLMAPDLGPGYRLLTWEGGAPCVGTGLTLQLTAVNASVSCTARYVKRVTVTATIQGYTGTGAAVTFNIAGCAPGACTVDVSTAVGLIAPDLQSKGWRFITWTAPCTGTELTTSVTPSGDVTCAAQYSKLKPKGAACTDASECLSNSCADHVCCDSACDGQCESCVAATPGVCTATVGAPVGRPACPSGEGVCAATCDGVTRASCTFPTVACGPISCTGAKEYAPTCASGSCQAPAVIRDCTTTPDTKRCGATRCAGVVDVTASNIHTFVVMSDGSVWGWGENYKGVLGPSAPPDATVRTPTRFTGLMGVKKLTSSPFVWHQCALMTDGRLLCWGDNRYSQLGIGPVDDVAHPVPRDPWLSALGAPLTGVIDVSVGTYHTCAVLSDKSVTCWGRGISGRLADQDITDHYVPYAGSKVHPDTTAEIIHSGEDHTCVAVEADTSSALKCWGPNSSGECGVAPSANTGGLVVSTMMTDLDATLPRGLALGNYVTCGVTTAGYLSCFGNNQGYQLGRGDDGLYYTEVPGPVCATATPDCNFSGTGVPLANVEAVSLGESHACALAGGQVKCWGENGNGQMGTGDLGGYVFYAGSGPTFAPAQLPVQQVTSGWYHSCALLADRTVACWGRNNTGELGVPAADYSIPSPVFPTW